MRRGRIIFGPIIIFQAYRGERNPTFRDRRVAKMLGISLEELSAATGIMTDSGIKGEQAGKA
ncbi:hypothetical protein [Bacillus wiedmannii]|uniref:hypothetical protein n=1 Tax=Bacillus wiedmannii TaxID=1890302 RepID=UPI0015CF5BFB|nr:hypothetical protein [Bacillus wiedmannii]